MHKLQYSKLGVPIDQVGGVGNSALMWAAMWGQTDICSYLLENGANADLTSKKGKKPSKLAQEAGYRTLATLIRSYEKV